MSEKRRNYRKKLASSGYIFLAGEELEIDVINISITGLFVELPANDKIKDIKLLFASIRDSSVIDLVIPDMRLAAETEIVRADKVDDLIYIGLEFKNVTYDVEDFIYKRKYYRKSLEGVGHIELGKQHYQFYTCNVSVEGMMIRINETVRAEKGTMASIDFPTLELAGEIEIVWLENEDSGNTIIGLKYLLLERAVRGIPAFSKKSKRKEIA